ncbi:MAG: endonuclease/exonuclease/phosphatase family protein [Bacteroidales bacterium]|nr:endonuclease/exonuclease/phosphatase family protein [Bacteroidales bacterium]
MLLALFFNLGYIRAVFQWHPASKELQQNSKRISTYNIQEFRYGVPSFTVDLIADFYRDKMVDIVCLQEFNTYAHYPLDSIRQAFGFLPYCSVNTNEEDEFSQAIFSKFPIVTGSSGKEGFSRVIWSDLVIGEDTIRVINVHLQTTNFNQFKYSLKHGNWILDYSQKLLAVKNAVDILCQNFLKRVNQIDLLSKHIESSPYPLMICGDFNVLPSSYIYHQIKNHLKDGFLSAGNGYEYTYRYLNNMFRSDYIFHSKEISVFFYKSFNLNYSDHKPVIMDFRVQDK